MLESLFKKVVFRKIEVLLCTPLLKNELHYIVTFRKPLSIYFLEHMVHLKVLLQLSTLTDLPEKNFFFEDVSEIFSLI